MKRVLAILVVTILVLGLLASGISCTKTVTEVVYVTATPKPTSTPAKSDTDQIIEKVVGYIEVNHGSSQVCDR